MGRPAYTRISVVAAAIVVATLLHMLTSPERLLWHNVFQRLYYLPIIYAALYFGWRGGLAAAFACALLYLPHIVSVWHHVPQYEMNQYAEIIVFVLVGSVTGVLADRERRRREELQATTEKLAQVNRELHESFEHLKRAERLSAIGQLSASLAHEIRNPLASIEGASEVLESPTTPDEVRTEFLGIIRKESRRLNRLLTNLLDFARPRTPELQDVDVGVLIESVTSLLAPAADKAGITFEKRLPDRPPCVASDPEQLKQVLLNITINALQAMPDGGRVEFGVAQKDAQAVITIRDQGPGIAEQDLDRVFDPFFTTKDTGTGLGLSVAHQIVTQHGGSIKAVRNPDRGMTFEIRLPVKREDTGDQTASAGGR